MPSDNDVNRMHIFQKENVAFCGTVQQLLTGVAMKSNRYEFLDGIRGIAAIFVVLFHTSESLKPSLAHSYLAVDLFFVLSGFVIAHAYDLRLKNGNIPALQFLRIRLTRLYPIYLLSVLVSLPLLMLGLVRDMPASYSNPSLVQISTLTISTALFLPFYVRGGYALFPLNQPYWSLFFELLTNIVYAVIRPILSNRLLTVIVVATGLMLVMLVKYFGKLNVGASWGLYSVVGGFARCIFGIFCGLLLYRRCELVPRFLRKPAMPWLAVLLIALVLSAPSFGIYDGFFDLLSVFTIFPLAVATASHGNRSKYASIMIMLGTASYPLYVFHSPVSQIVGHWGGTVLNEWGAVKEVLLIGAIMLVGVWLEKHYDLPARHWLSKLGKKRGDAPKFMSIS
jgi:peptidoglycan/LPS O-acetylase OafA/YrhL